LSEGKEDTPPGTTALAPERPALVLPSGRAIEVESQGDGDVIRFLARGGACMLTVRLTDEGPVLRVEGASLEIAASKKLSLECEDLSIAARNSAAIAVGGDLEERVAGSVQRVAAGVARTAARRVDIEASPGGIDLRANDDVRVTGERVMLNSDDPPMPVSWEEFEARRQARAALAEKGEQPGSTEDGA
jgi:hypothetical protein